MADKKPRKFKLVKGTGGPSVNKIICFHCRQTIRWYPCPRCKKRPT